jgi:hypothetical protein
VSLRAGHERRSVQALKGCVGDDRGRIPEFQWVRCVLQGALRQARTNPLCDRNVVSRRARRPRSGPGGTMPLIGRFALQAYCEAQQPMCAP